MIRIDNISVTIEKVAILQNISANLVEPRIGIIGDNGSGKSILSRCITRLQSLSSGDIHIFDNSVRKKSYEVWKEVGLVYQIPDQQIIMPTVEEELCFGLHNMKLTKSEIQQRLEYALSLCSLSPKHICHTLSAGQKRLLTLLSILIMQPKIIILDEPTTFLDLPSKLQFMHLLENLSQQVIFISHELDIMQSFHKILWLHNGHVCAYDEPHRVINSYLTHHKGEFSQNSLT